ncbi:hypothetical protein KZZ52_27090 [Dactylosporangium sp. AC04546]|uniref:hypothetical protein n=1 Tax=Dactylosporangium sp. AC04546 TaxID=2862460 RepID=UPI001EDF8586|nr:hypothetical protein [Dactylosporangium sp. AC04546]WVK88932.1 hypothetical protein KZZ52_27090 [Dactylosporangium sp. AC04546]
MTGDLARAFDPEYAAVDLFTDRVGESKALADALLHHVERMVAGAATPTTSERHNVLVYYGIGGVGKTELSRRLERWINGDLADPGEWLPRPRFDQPVHTVRVDFHGSTAVDPADVVLKLRAAVAGIRRRFHAFDIGMAVWWSHSRPGLPLPVLRAPSGFDVNGQIMDTIKDAINGTHAPLGLAPVSVRVAARLLAAAREQTLKHITRRDCPQLVHVLEAAERDASPAVAAALAGLLSWDLTRLTLSEQPIIVAFADAAEYIQGRDRQQEKLLHTLVRNTPSVLWVITSRNSLDWADPSAAATLDPGRITWPGLRLGALEDPRQHLVGDLADADVVRYLDAASGSGGNPHLSPAVVDRIRAGAHGLPLYLDLSMALARSTVGEPDPARFGQPLPDLAVRVLADLPDAERDLARTASLLPRFSTALIAEATRTRHGDAERFCRRSLVSQDGHPAFPYRLHDAVRHAVVGEAVGHAGAWSDQDRRAAAEALVEALRRRHNELTDDALGRLDVLELVAWVAAGQRLHLPWLLTALTDLPSLTRTAERIPAAPVGTWMWHVRRMFDAWRESDGADRCRYLEQLLTTDLPDDVRRAATRRLAYHLRTSNQPGRALQLLTGLLAEKPESDLLRYQIGRTLREQSRYADLEAFLAANPISDPTAARRLAADLAFDRGDVVVGYEGALARAAALRSDGRFRIALENDVVALWRGALTGHVTAAHCDDMITEIDQHGSRLSLRTAFAAKMVCCLTDPDAFGVMSAAVDQIVTGAQGYHGWREWATAILHGLRHDDPALIARVYVQRRARPDQGGPNYRLVDRLLVHAGYAPVLPDVQLDTEEERVRIAARWTAVFNEVLSR